MPRLTEGWREVLISALGQAGFVLDKPKYNGKIVIMVSDGGIKFVEVCQTVK